MPFVRYIMCLLLFKIIRYLRTNSQLTFVKITIIKMSFFGTFTTLCKNTMERRQNQDFRSCGHSKTRKLERQYVPFPCMFFVTSETDFPSQRLQNHGLELQQKNSFYVLLWIFTGNDSVNIRLMKRKCQATVKQMVCNWITNRWCWDEWTTHFAAWKMLVKLGQRLRDPVTTADKVCCSPLERYRWKQAVVERAKKGQMSIWEQYHLTGLLAYLLTWMLGRSVFTRTADLSTSGVSHRHALRVQSAGHHHPVNI